MRFGEFKPQERKPIGVGQDKKTFVNPLDDKKVISVIKGKEEREKLEVVEKNTPRRLKGSFYLTKIAHLLLPKHVPDIHQAGETVGGQQSIDRERVELSAAPNSEIGAVIDKLDRLGFAFNVDEHGDDSDYTKDKDGNISYLSTLTPWRVDPAHPEKSELVVDVKALRRAINRVAKNNPETAEKCSTYLERILELFEEEKIELEKERIANLKEYGPALEALEVLYAAFETKHDLAALETIKNPAEALANQEREAAKKDLFVLWAKLEALKNETDIPTEQYSALVEKDKGLRRRAVGKMSGGMNGTVDHTR